MSIGTITADAIKADAERCLANVNGITTIPESALCLKDFYSHLPTHQYIFVPTCEMWPASSVDSVLGPVGKKSASKYLDQTRAVEQLTWAPGEPRIIRDKLIADGGYIKKAGARCFNRYIPPTITGGDPHAINLWMEHVKSIFPDDTDHIVRWLAHRIQRPAEKINHALVLGGAQGVGKDSILEPAKDGVGPWNFVDVAPHHLFGRFNGYARSVILRISEARDLGDVDRYSFYERTKVYTAAPPDVIRIDEKNLREYPIPNLCGVIITTNHLDGLYLPADDRRHYVAWSESTKEDFDPAYWRKYYIWLDESGRQNVAAYLGTVNLRKFDAKAPPPKTNAWQRIVDAGRATEDAELADVIDDLGELRALTLEMLCKNAPSDFREWLADRRNRRLIPHRLQTAGYVPVRNNVAKDGLWKISERRQAVYARQDLTLRDRLAAANELRDRLEAKREFP